MKRFEKGLDFLPQRVIVVVSEKVMRRKAKEGRIEMYRYYSGGLTMRGFTIPRRVIKLVAQGKYAAARDENMIEYDICGSYGIAQYLAIEEFISVHENRSTFTE